MPLLRTLLLLFVLAFFGRGRFCGSPSHSLCYSYLYLPEPSQDLPQSFIRNYLDDQPIACFDSLTRKMEPLVSWVEEAEKEEETFQVVEWVIGIDLQQLSKLDRHAGGLHTWQAVVGCELKEDGSKGGFLHYGYNGMDFISFDKETLRWVTAQPQAQKVKEKWEELPGMSQRKNIYLEKTCIEWLQRYQSYKKEAPQRIDPPVGKVTHKMVNERLEVLICQAFGFYPKDIRATWTRDGEVCEYEMLPRNVAPNSDGTYYVWLSIEIDPKERDHFRCYLEHEGLQEPLILALKDKRATTWAIPLGIVVLALGILFSLCWWWRCREKPRSRILHFLCSYFFRNSTTSIEEKTQQVAVVDRRTVQAAIAQELSSSNLDSSQGFRRSLPQGVVLVSIHGTPTGTPF
ncbi:major histocompatibility complex class I-related gene protein-like [Thamnophis elegans]|uniref:major histocompatibility complex class I-related gene protein-like n=1 Tax=Thamnophis elegans TaxID=35005 RepID=UPI0013789480|nr:major histocompatibility complex class I-related gene protein-like [Thamnophis elegans]